MVRATLLLTAVVASGAPLAAQAPKPEDVATPEAVVRATYDAISRAPGAPFQWDRFRSLFLPEARLIPNTEQTGGRFTVHTVDSFISWIDEGWKRVIGTPQDRGFAESHVAGITEQFGDVAHVFSTYEKHIWNDKNVIGRGINSIQLVKKDGRWWISAIAWDEEPAGGQVPAKYLPR